MGPKNTQFEAGKNLTPPRNGLIIQMGFLEVKESYFIRKMVGKPLGWRPLLFNPPVGAL